MFTSNYARILIVLFSSNLISQSISQTYCPLHCSTCLPNVISCISGGMVAIPVQLQPGTEKIILSGQFQFHGILTNANFTHLAPPKYKIYHLAIKGSSVHELRPRTFSPLTLLQTLDLSENQRLTVFQSSFDRLQLKHLRLDDIGKLILSTGCFNGLRTDILSMRNARLQLLNYDIFRTLSHTLKHLYIENNQIRTLDQKFEPLFYRLESVNLKDNPLICYCPLLWLSKALRSKMLSGRYQSSLDDNQSNPNDDNNSPKCVAPSYLRNRQLESITELEFNCQVPQISRIEIDIMSQQNGELRCKITPEEKGHKIPTRVFWKETFQDGATFQRSIGNIQTDQISVDESEVKDSSAIVRIEGIGNSQKRNFKCIAENSAGTSTMAVQIWWPFHGNIDKSQTPKNTSLLTNKYDLSNTNHVTTELFLFKKNYTLLEMTVAIVGTFMVTVLVFLILYRFYFRRKNGYKSGKPSLKYSLTGESPNYNKRSLMAFHSPRSGYTVYETSMHYSDNSQTYDSIPHNAVYPNQQQPLFSTLSNSPSAHFIDYKTHKNLYPSSPA